MSASAMARCDHCSEKIISKDKDDIAGGTYCDAMCMLGDAYSVDYRIPNLNPKKRAQAKDVFSNIRFVTKMRIGGPSMRKTTVVITLMPLNREITRIPFIKALIDITPNDESGKVNRKIEEKLDELRKENSPVVEAFRQKVPELFANEWQYYVPPGFGLTMLQSGSADRPNRRRWIFISW